MRVCIASVGTAKAAGVLNIMEVLMEGRGTGLTKGAVCQSSVCQ